MARKLDEASLHININKVYLTECGNYDRVYLISNAGKIMLNIIQNILEPYMQQEMSDIQAGFWKGQDITTDTNWIIEKTKECQKEVIDF